MEKSLVMLGNLYPGSEFFYDSTTYTVLFKEADMVEVVGKGRLWAWPSRARVERILKSIKPS